MAGGGINGDERRDLGGWHGGNEIQMSGAETYITGEDMMKCDFTKP